MAALSLLMAKWAGPGAREEQQLLRVGIFPPLLLMAGATFQTASPLEEKAWKTLWGV